MAFSSLRRMLRTWNRRLMRKQKAKKTKKMQMNDPSSSRMSITVQTLMSSRVTFKSAERSRESLFQSISSQVKLKVMLSLNSKPRKAL